MKILALATTSNLKRLLKTLKQNGLIKDGLVRGFGNSQKQLQFYCFGKL